VNAIEQKAAIRAQVRAGLEALSDSERATASAEVCRRLKQQAIWQRARAVLFYAPLAGEVDVWPLATEAIASGKQVALPRFDASAGKYAAHLVGDSVHDLVIGRFGIREPSPRCARLATGRADLILVPGVAFDLRGNRLGRGRGYYDRLLEEFAGPRCGVAFDQQIVAGLPREAHDLRMDMIVTPTRWLESIA
jgi:5-formyltetrahydrofolate cyclo-ligase